MLLLLQGGISTYINYLECCFKGDLSFLPHLLIYLFNHSFTSVWTQWIPILYCTLVDNPILCIYFIAQIVPALAVGSYIGWHLCMTSFLLTE